MNGQKPTVAIVTGASSGIGASFARRLTRAHIGRERYRGLPAFDELWLVARRMDRLEALQNELVAEASGLAVRCICMDLTDPEAPAELASRLSTGDATLSVLVNNAGYGIYGPFAEAPLQKQLGEIDLNCRALTALCGALSPHLAAASLVVNVASLAAFAPLGNFAVYAATKAYVLSFSMALAAEWEGRGIRVHALCPGPVQSEFSLVASGGARKEVLHGQDPDATTRACLRAASRGAWVSLPKLSWRLSAWAMSFISRKAVARATWRFAKRPQADSQGTGD